MLRRTILAFIYIGTAVALLGAPRMLGADAGGEPPPEARWGCVTGHGPDGVPQERCGLGYDRRLCGMAEGVELCEVFFELLESEPPDDPFARALEDLFLDRHLALSAAWGDRALLPDEETYLPLGAERTLAWEFKARAPEGFSLRGSPGVSLEEALDAATFTIQVYRGPIGSASLVMERTLGPGEREAPLTLTEPGAYVVILSAGFPHGSMPPGSACATGGDLCLLYDGRIESLAWFMEHGAGGFGGDGLPIEESYFYEDGERKSRMATFRQVAIGMLEIEVVAAEERLPGSVLFLPGIKGSRLYRPSDSCDPLLSLSCPGVKLWEPGGSLLVRDPFLDATGAGARDDVYLREGDILTEAFGSAFYESFAGDMDALAREGSISGWRAAAYDWRLSLDALVSGGAVGAGKLTFGTDVAEPYLERLVEELAEGSPSGSVTIVAHSNGGLVAKALMRRLEADGKGRLVESMVLVGVPQTGAPQAIGALLFGHGEALPFDRCASHPLAGPLCSLLVSREAARGLAEHAPMAYHLLPSRAYFGAPLAALPVISFEGTHAHASERERYGRSVDSVDELHAFLRADEGGRAKPEPEDTAHASVLPPPLLAYGESAHDAIDGWLPPDRVRVLQIAGQGADTITGIEFYEEPRMPGGYRQRYRPRFARSGDGVVPDASATHMEGIDGVETARADLGDYSHGTMLEMPGLRALVRDAILGRELAPTAHASRARPAAGGEEVLRVFLHSPLSLRLLDGEGRSVGRDAPGAEGGIPGARYDEFGDVKIVSAPEGAYEVLLLGEGEGSFSLDIERSRMDRTVSMTTFADLPATMDTSARLRVELDEGALSLGPLRVDVDGDGADDIVLHAGEGGTALPREGRAGADSSSRRSEPEDTEEDAHPEPMPPAPVPSETTGTATSSAPASPTEDAPEAEERDGHVPRTPMPSPLPYERALGEPATPPDPPDSISAFVSAIVGAIARLVRALVSLFV